MQNSSKHSPVRRQRSIRNRAEPFPCSEDRSLAETSSWYRTSGSCRRGGPPIGTRAFTRLLSLSLNPGRLEHWWSWSTKDFLKATSITCNGGGTRIIGNHSRNTSLNACFHRQVPRRLASAKMRHGSTTLLYGDRDMDRESGLWNERIPGLSTFA